MGLLLSKLLEDPGLSLEQLLLDAVEEKLVKVNPKMRHENDFQKVSNQTSEK